MICMDVDDDASVTRGVQQVLERAGRIDAVVNNAGVGWMGALEDTTIDEAKAQMETNFFGVLRVCHRAADHAAATQRLHHQHGLASRHHRPPLQRHVQHSKFALEGMSESLRFETRPFGIHVVIIEPGDFRTQMINTRRLAAASETNDAYRTIFKRMKDQQDQSESQSPAEPVAQL